MGDHMDILMVDDDRELLKQAKIYLEKEDADFNVETVISPQKSLDLLENEDYDAIVADYKMAEIDGLELLESIRDDRGNDIPFIMFTGKGREEVAIEALNLGADRYIQKGGDPKSQYGVLSESIVQEVEHARAENKLRKELDERNEKVTRLHERANELVKCESEKEICELVVKTSEEILDFDVCGVDFVENDQFVPIAISSEIEDGFIKRDVDKAGISKKAYREKESLLIEDRRDIDFSKPVVSDYRASITIPMGNIGIYQALSTEIGAFSEKDLELAEILVNHAKEAIDRVRFKERLIERKRKYEKVFEDNPEAMVEADENFRIQKVNRKFEDLFGFKEDHLIGKNINDLIVPDELTEEAKKLDERSQKEGYFEHETIRLTKSGKEVSVSITGRPIEQEGDIHHLAVYRDITERKEAEERLHNRMEKIESLHSTAAELETCQSREEVFEIAVETADKILDFDTAGIVVPVENMLEVKKSYGDFVEEGKRPISIEDSFAGKTYLENESYLVEDIDLADRASPTHEAYGSGISVSIGKFGVFQATSFERDIFEEDDLKMTELLIDHVTKALTRIEMNEREDFLHSLLRHDLRNKIQTIKGYIHLLDDFEGSEKKEELREKASSACRKGSQMIEKVRLLRKLEDVDTSEVSIKSSVEKNLKEYRAKASEKGKEIILEDFDYNVKGGPLLEELFGNILENSILHSGCETIKISSEERNDEIIVKIEDDGRGIPDEEKEKIFKRGYKKGEEAGSGLGMYLVKEIIESYGGRIKVKDSEMGGARFDVHLKKVSS